MKSRKKPKSNMVSTKTLPGAGSEPLQSAKVGGIGNTPQNTTKNYGKGK